MRWLIVLGTLSATLAAVPVQAQSGMTPAEREILEILHRFELRRYRWWLAGLEAQRILKEQKKG